MRFRLVLVLMTTLFLVNMLIIVGSVSAAIPQSEGDIVDDDKVDILDVLEWAIAFGSTPTSSNWNSVADVDGNNVVNILDGAVIGVNFGRQG